MFKSQFLTRILLVLAVPFFSIFLTGQAYAQKSSAALYADSLYRQGDFEQAAAAFHQVARQWQQQQQLDSVNLYELWEAISYTQFYEYEKSRSILRTILSRPNIEKDAATRSRVNHQMAYNNVSDGHFQEAKSFSDKSIQIEESRTVTDTFQLAKYYELNGFISMQLDDFDAAKSLTTKAYLLRTQILEPMDKELGYSANTLYIVLSTLGDLKAADTVIRTAWTILKNNLPEDHPHIAVMANNYSNHLQDMGDPQGAKNFLIEAIASNKKGKRYYPLMPNYVNLGTLYLILNDNNTAESYFRQALAIADTILGYPDYNHANVEDALGAVLYKTDRLDEAEALFKAALQEKQDLFEPEQSEIAQSFYNLGLIAEARKNWKPAEDFFKKSERIRSQGLGKNHPKRADALYELAEIDWENDKKDAAVQRWSICHQIYAENFGLSHLHTVENLVRLAEAEYELKQFDSLEQHLKLAWGGSCKLNQPLSGFAMLDTLAIDTYNPQVLYLANLHLKVLLEKQGSMTGEDVKTARYIFKIVHQWLPTFLSLFDDATVWETIANEVQDFYRLSAIIAHRALLAADANRQVWEGVLLNCIQASRGTTIQAAFRDRQAIRFAGVPDSLVEQSQKLRQQLQFTFARQQEEEEEDLSQMTEQQLSILQEWEELQRYMKEQYPKYYEARFEIPSVDIAALQQNLEDHHYEILAYFNLDTALLAVNISSDHLQSSWLPMDEHWQDSLQTYQQMLLQRTADQHLASLGYYLYQNLWEPLHLPPQSRVKVLADGPLYYFNFETLLTKKNADISSLSAWPWLIRDYFVHYGHTLPLAEINAANNGKVLGIAPGFTQDLKQDYLNNLSQNQHPDSVFLHWVRTPWSSSFVEQLQEKGWGAALTALNATETAFQQEAPTANVLHFGTHARLENEKPLYSFLALTPDPKSEQDGYLYTYELYREPLNAQLAVLTACETGLGKYRKGEGVLSLAHAFRYAGCPSVIYSLWEIDDEQSNEITAVFYENLNNGMQVAEALRAAKLAYLDQAKGSYQTPYFWAGLILTGEDQPIHIGSPFSYLKIAGIVFSAFLVTLVAFFLVKKKK